MKYFFKYLLLVLATIIVGCNNVSKGSKVSPKGAIDDYSDKIDSLIQTTNPRNFNGVILITKKGETKYAKTFGYSDMEEKTPFTLDDKFMIMSNSKQITAVLILKEVEKKKIDLESSVRTYLPDLPQAWADTVTVHQLLNFSSGITSIDAPLSFKPGTNFLYGVTTYTMLSKILEKVTGEKFITLANNLFAELGMKNSSCYEEHQAQTQVLKGYVNTNNVFKIRERQIQGQGWIDFIPAGGIISSANDLSIWDANLHKGKLLKPETYQLMINYNITDDHEAFGTEKYGYGHGVRVGNVPSKKFIGHGGKGLGFVSIKVYFPEKEVDLIVLENQYHEDNNLAYYHESKIREIVMNSNLLK